MVSLTDDGLYVPQFGDITKDILNEFRMGWEQERYNAQINQKRIAAANYASGPRKHLSFGFVKMQVDAAAYHYWGRRLGYECWRDKAFTDWFAKKNPEAKVESRSDKTTILAGKPADPSAKLLI